MKTLNRFVAAVAVLSGGVLAFSAGCQQAPQPPTLDPLSPEERQAVDLAQEFLVKNGLDWGNPSQVRLAQVEYVPGWKGEGYYEVTYPTPADEIKVLGDRAVVVEIKSGKAAFVPRC